MKVKDVMTAGRLKVCTPETKVANVVKIMKDNNKGALPVVDKTQKVIGILTDRDLAISLSRKTRKTAAEISVKDVLPKLKLCTVKAEDEVSDALREMRRNKIGRLPVVNPEGKLEGMISVDNILSRAINRNEAIGQISSRSENLAKTVKALLDRDNTPPQHAKEGTVELNPGEKQR